MRPKNFKLRGEFLLFSVVLFFVATPLLENDRTGEFFLVLTLYLTLITATLQLAEDQELFWSAIPLAVTSMLLLLLSHFSPRSLLLVVNSVVLALFLALVCIGLFNYLGRTGPITSGRLYVSVSIYFLIAMCWFSLDNVINKVHPGSFAVNGIPLPAGVHPSILLYFSLATLTTLGYGDIIPLTSVARMFAALEAAVGVLYIAITVARLVSDYQKTPSGQ